MRASDMDAVITAVAFSRSNAREVQRNVQPDPDNYSPSHLVDLGRAPGLARKQGQAPHGISEAQRLRAAVPRRRYFRRLEDEVELLLDAGSQPRHQGGH